MANYIGYGHVEGAYGPVITIQRDKIDGCKLILVASSGACFEEFGNTKNAIEHFGCGLRIIKIQEYSKLSKQYLEVVIEPIPDSEPKEIYVFGEKRMSPTGTYVIATDFKGHVNIHLYREPENGEREEFFGMSPAYNVFYE